MQSKTIKDTYPVQAITIQKSETRFKNTDEIVTYIEDSIANHPVAGYIATFDHYTHTKNLPEHNLGDHIVDIKNVIFCFGKELPIPEMAAVRPRSIAIVEEEDKFVVSFMDAPNPQAHDTMTAWVKGIVG
jgi:hypothetical protein